VQEFVHLHNHSDYSLLKGAARISDIVEKAGEMGMQHLALTDDGNMFGALEFYQACRSAGINPIIGCDFYVAGESRHIKTPGRAENRSVRLVLLARNHEGYRNLIMLSSLGYTEGFYYKPRIDKELLQQYSEGLIALSGGLSGEIPLLIRRNRMDEAAKAAQWYRDLFGPENFYLEMMDHGIPEERVVNDGLKQLAQDLDLPLVVANDTHYVAKEDAAAQDVLLCIGSNKKRHETNRFKFSTEEFYLKSPEDMAALFPETAEALANSVRIAERCELEIELPGPMFPDYSIPEEFESPDAYLRHLTFEGLKERYDPVTDDHRERAEYELNIVISMGFTGYFLIVWDFIKFARDNGIPVGPGRGSGAGSIVAYALRITDIDPFKYGLLFERFLNPDRVSMPDFDIDFCYERRGEVIDYVTRKYGYEKVGQIITFGTLKAKAVIRDVARVLDYSFAEADQIAKKIPGGPKVKLKEAIEADPELQEMAAPGSPHADLIAIAKKLEGLHRHASTHAAGIVIGQKALTEYVPLYRDPRTGSISTQFTMDQLEDCGLVKMDFLGLKTLTLIENTQELIRKRGIDFDHEQMPEDDENTFRLLGKGKSAAVFQFESGGMQAVLTKAKPTSIKDLIALNALYRPGPMENIDQFVESKHGRTPIRFPLKELEPVLQETYGVIVYQEQVMEIVRIVGGFSLGQADILRRAMGKKKIDQMEKMKAEFLDGAVEKGFTREQAEAIFDLLKPFAGYGFNKSHAAAYSVLAYKTAYLKANYPVEFMAANLTNEINNPDTFAWYLDETRSMGIDVRPPDVNASDKYFTVAEIADSVGDDAGGLAEAAAGPGATTGEDDPKGRGAHQLSGTANQSGARLGIRYGLVGIKNMGSAAVDEILRERREHGPFASFQDFLERVDLRTVNRKMIEVGIQCGLFDGLDNRRRTLLANLDNLLDHAAKTQERRRSGQGSLFEAEESAVSAQLEYVEETDPVEWLEYERDYLGAYFSGHPMDAYQRRWERCVHVNLGRLTGISQERAHQLLGLLTDTRVITTKNGNPMAFGKLEDFNGQVEIVLFENAYEASRELLHDRKVVGALGTFEERRGRMQFVVEKLVGPEDLEETAPTPVHIRLAVSSSVAGGGGGGDGAGDYATSDRGVAVSLRPGTTREELYKLRAFLYERRGNCPVYIHLGENGKETVVKASSQLTVSGKESILEEIRSYGPVEAVWTE
jgi:DNA polymerase-3 subunit alpha